MMCIFFIYTVRYKTTHMNTVQLNLKRKEKMKKYSHFGRKEIEKIYIYNTSLIFLSKRKITY